MIQPDTLDDEPVPDGDGAWQGGQVSGFRRNLLKPGQAFKLVNIDLNKNGRPTTRRGTTNLGALVASANVVLGLAYFDIPTLERLVMVKNGAVTQYDDATDTWAAAAGFAPANVPCDMVQGNNKLFLSNGADNMRSWDGAAFTDLGTGGTNAPKATVLTWMTSRLIATGIATDPDAVWFNNVLADGAAGTWPVNGRIRVGEGDGDPIVAAIQWNKYLYVVLKRSSVWTVDVDPTRTVATFPIDCISSRIGCVARRSVARVGNDIWFLSDHGVHSLRRVLTTAENEVSVPISEPIQDIIDAMSEATASKACGVFHNNRYMLSIPSGAAAQPDTVLVFNTQTQSWSGTWTGWTPTIFVPSQFGGIQRLNFGMADGRVWRWRDWVKDTAEAATDFKDGGATSYETIMEGRAYLFGSVRNWKNGFDLEAEFNESSATAVAITPILDEVTGTTLATINSGIGGLVFPITFPITFAAPGIKRVNETLMHLDRFRELAIKIRSATGKLALRSLTLTAQNDGPDL